MTTKEHLEKHIMETLEELRALMLEEESGKVSKERKDEAVSRFKSILELMLKEGISLHRIGELFNDFGAKHSSPQGEDDEEV